MADLTPTVLVIDDDASVRGALRDLFESVGLRVTVFEFGSEILAGRTTEYSLMPGARCAIAWTEWA